MTNNVDLNGSITRSRQGTNMRIAFLGSYPPRECGIASFMADLAAAIDQQGLHTSRIIAIDEPGTSRVYPSRVVWQIQQNECASYSRVAAAVGQSGVDIVSVQHEYGLFGSQGIEGEMFLNFLQAVPIPVVTTLHSVLPNPSPRFRKVTQAISAMSAEIVVPARSAIPLLRDVYDIAPSHITYIPHGIPMVDRRCGVRRAVKKRLGYSGRTLISTLGLIRPEKGIEYAIQALPPIVEHHPEVLFLVLGPTHPHEIGSLGDSYRDYLQTLVDELGLRKSVQFVNHHLDLGEVIDYLLATDIYLIPYLNPEQIVSGTLAYAVGCGKAIIATPFPYAQEVLSDDRGMIVPFRSSDSISGAVKLLLETPVFKADLESRAYSFGRTMVWPSVAATYREVFYRHANFSAKD